MLKNRAIILAAGSSRRMGTQKMLLPYGNTTMLGSVIQNVLSSSVDSVHVVLGADHIKILDHLKSLPVEICYNQDHLSGMLSSVICGFNSLPGDTGAALVFLGDQPSISPRVTNAVIAAYNDSLHGIVIPIINHRRGHPLLVDLKYKRDIGRLDLEQGLRALMHHFPEDVLEVEVNDPGILIDIDTPEEYQKVNKKPS